MRSRKLIYYSECEKVILGLREFASKFFLYVEQLGDKIAEAAASVLLLVFVNAVGGGGAATVVVP